MTEGAYRRRVRIAGSGGTVTAEVEDDFHHFVVELTADGGVVTGIRGYAVRFPWDTCPSAAAELSALVGMPLSPTSTAVGGVAPPRRNCTHMFDLAGLAVASAWRGGGTRQYDIRVPEPDQGRTTATLDRDGSRFLTWALSTMTITAPEPFAGQQLRGGFIAWAEENLDADTAEAAIVFRRACEVAGGRPMDLDALDDATPLLEIMRGSCYSFQPERNHVPVRMKGSIRDFSDRPDELLHGR